MHQYSERIKREEFKEWNERMVKKYDPDAFHHHPNRIIHFIEEKRVKTIVRMMDIHEKDRVLEVGCGAGNVLEKTSSGELFGVDLSIYILNKAKQKLNKSVFLFQGDAQNLPCKNEVFDHVICSEVLEHLLDPAASLHEIERILNPQGIAVISLPNERWINRIKGILIHIGIFDWLFRGKGEYRDMPEKMEDEWHLQNFPLEHWLNLFKGSFRVTGLRRIPYFWLPLRYVVRLERMR